MSPPNVLGSVLKWGKLDLNFGLYLQWDLGELLLNNDGLLHSVISFTTTCEIVLDVEVHYVLAVCIGDVSSRICNYGKFILSFYSVLSF